MIEKNSNNQYVSINEISNIEIEKGIEHIVVELIEYIPNAIVSKTIIKKSTGNITAMSFDEGEELTEKITPFDLFIQIISGSAIVVINKKEIAISTGSAIVIPALSLYLFRADTPFKMISTVIKAMQQ